MQNISIYVYIYILLYVFPFKHSSFFFFLGLVEFLVWSQDSGPLTSQQSARIFSVKSLPRKAAWCNHAD